MMLWLQPLRCYKQRDTAISFMISLLPSPYHYSHDIALFRKDFTTLWLPPLRCYVVLCRFETPDSAVYLIFPIFLLESSLTPLKLSKPPLRWYHVKSPKSKPLFPPSGQITIYWCLSFVTSKLSYYLSIMPKVHVYNWRMVLTHFYVPNPCCLEKRAKVLANRLSSSILILPFFSIIFQRYNTQDW